MGPIWGRQVPGGPHVGPMNFAIWIILIRLLFVCPIFSWIHCNSFENRARLDFKVMSLPLTLLLSLPKWLISFVFVNISFGGFEWPGREVLINMWKYALIEVWFARRRGNISPFGKSVNTLIDFGSVKSAKINQTSPFVEHLALVT